MIVITGANGAFGRLVVEQLLTRMPAAELVVSVREPAASPFAAQGISVRHGDFDEPATLPAAFAGAHTVLINGTNYGAPSADRARQQAAALRAAHNAGATRIVVTTWADLDNCPLEFVRDFPETEKLAAAWGPGWTVLRMTYGMAASLARDVNTARQTGVLTAPAGIAHATPTSVRELADAAATVLVEPGHDARTYELTGPDAISWDDLAALASDVSGRSIAYRPVSDEEFGVQVRAAGWPPPAVDMLLDYYRAFRAGWANTPQTDLAAVLRRPATGSIEAVREAL
jgi:NAD(P)H dehydrogenase (quinone)